METVNRWLFVCMGVCQFACILVFGGALCVLLLSEKFFQALLILPVFYLQLELILAYQRPVFSWGVFYLVVALYGMLFCSSVWGVHRPLPGDPGAQVMAPFLAFFSWFNLSFYAFMRRRLLDSQARLNP